MDRTDCIKYLALKEYQFIINYPYSGKLLLENILTHRYAHFTDADINHLVNIHCMTADQLYTELSTELSTELENV